MSTTTNTNNTLTAGEVVTAFKAKIEAARENGETISAQDERKLFLQENSDLIMEKSKLIYEEMNLRVEDDNRWQNRSPKYDSAVACINSLANDLKTLPGLS